jgi:hypothetical protein
MVAGNRAVPLLTAGVAPHLLEPPVNVLRVSLHPEGVAPRILNLAEWRAHLLDRLGREAVASGDIDITVSELSIEAFFPADDVTSEFVRSWAERR